MTECTPHQAENLIPEMSVSLLKFGRDLSEMDLVLRQVLNFLGLLALLAQKYLLY
jgi:hypothetical protein